MGPRFRGDDCPVHVIPAKAGTHLLMVLQTRQW